MFTRLFLAVILTALGAQSASAGMIVDPASTPEIIAPDAMMPRPDEGGAPVSVEQGVAPGMSATVVSSTTMSTGSA